MTITDLTYFDQIGGAVHDLGSIKVKWVFENKYLMYYKDGRKSFTTTFATVRYEHNRNKQKSDPK